MKIKNEHDASTRARQQKNTFCETPFYLDKIALFIENIHGAKAKRKVRNPRTTSIIILREYSIQQQQQSLRPTRHRVQTSEWGNTPATARTSCAELGLAILRTLAPPIPRLPALCREDTNVPYPGVTLYMIGVALREPLNPKVIMSASPSGTSPTAT